MGIDNERLALEWVSSAEGARFAAIVSSFTDKVKKLGKLPLGVAA
jgi:F420-non-reducing hydrogenase iron-sulfur subunit